MQIAVVCAHPDDEVLGCGGTLLKHASNNDEISLLFISEGVTSRYDSFDIKKHEKEIEMREESARKVAAILGAKEVEFLRYPNLRMDDGCLLALTKQIIGFFHKTRPDLVYMHSSVDLNYDHRLCSEAVLTAIRPVDAYTPKEVYAFEVPSSTDWAYGRLGVFSPNMFHDISEFMQKKLDLLSIYDYELRPHPHPRSVESLTAQAILNGAYCQMKYAERFETIRLIR